MPLEWVLALVGGVVIGVSATMLLLVCGRIAGISGILFGAMCLEEGKSGQWRIAMLLGFLAGGLIGLQLLPDPFQNTAGIPLPLVALAGGLVGYGTRLGGGCTSGHGVCGISRLSTRSITATISFILAGVVAVAIKNLLGG